MQSKTLLKKILLVAVCVGFAFSPVFVFYFIPEGLMEKHLARFVSQDDPHPVKVEQKKPALPVRLKIPRLGVNAVIEYVGLTPEGAMDVPKGPADVAWYNLGPRPGEVGSAVISGHYGWKYNIPAVFDDLDALKNGDTIYVEDDAGIISRFIVRETQLYDPNANASAVFLSNDGKSHLNLITCEGVWNAKNKSYSKRLVVFTDKVVLE